MSVNKYDFVIHDDKVVLRELRYHKEIPLLDFVKEIYEREILIETKQLPTNCIKYSRGKQIEKYYIHIPEDFYTLIENGKPYVVRLPTTIFIFTFLINTTKTSEDVMISWSDKEDVDLKSASFFQPLLPNVFTKKSGENKADIPYTNMCIDLPKDATSQKEYVEEFIDIFFKTSFNDDLSEGKKKIKTVSAEQKLLIERNYPEQTIIKAWWHEVDDNGRIRMSRYCSAYNTEGVPLCK